MDKNLLKIQSNIGQKKPKYVYVLCKFPYIILQQTRLDITDLRIMKLLSRDSRTPYRNIASAVGIMPSAAKERINKMVSNGAIRSFVIFVNPVILGYEKECILILKCQVLQRKGLTKWCPMVQYEPLYYL